MRLSSKLNHCNRLSGHDVSNLGNKWAKAGDIETINKAGSGWVFLLQMWPLSPGARSEAAGQWGLPVVGRKAGTSRCSRLCWSSTEQFVFWF